jgi:predicted GIY-YIG superfamily endonuclease
MYYVYVLKCSDQSYYIGSTDNLERRLAQHQSGFFKNSYTNSRLPVELVWSAEFATHAEAFQRERQIKGWARSKKEALIRGDWDGLHEIVKRERKERETKKRNTHPSTTLRSAQDA